ncbi:MAG: 3-dehydroquinate synthase [Chitinophagaceae bacterium]
MRKKIFQFKESHCTIYFNNSFSHLEKIADKDNTILLIDKTVCKKHVKQFQGWKIILCEGGDEHKNQTAVNSIITQLITMGANRQTFLIGVGGGVVTDITGFVAGIYMRGIRFGFVPTTLLAMADAALGGKNGINSGLYKNMIGLISQPSFILYDKNFLNSLPKKEWVNGFAEIIKHACIRDQKLFDLLEKSTLTEFQNDSEKLELLIQKNALLKMRIVLEDPHEKNIRKLLNFGHTLGHAIENEQKLPHGHAISIGMVAAARLSRNILNFGETERIILLLKKYGLPVHKKINASVVFEMMQSDKKTRGNAIDYILLKKIGRAEIRSVPMPQLLTELQKLSNAVHH